MADEPPHPPAVKPEGGPGASAQGGLPGEDPSFITLKVQNQVCAEESGGNGERGEGEHGRGVPPTQGPSLASCAPGMAPPGFGLAPMGEVGAGAPS